MAFISGIQIIHAPASALNNAGNNGGETDNIVQVKSIRVANKAYPYVSAQSYRYWLRSTLEELGSEVWTTAPIFREKKIAYTDANPISYCDDDLFGYMRAPGKKVEAADSRAAMTGDTPTKETVTRVSPFRVGTLVGLSDGVTKDFGTMSRQEGNPVPHEHQFYRTSLKGMFSLDLGSSGSFSYQNRTGFLNLDEERIKIAQEQNLQHNEKQRTYALSTEERTRRISLLLRSMPVITGGAKQGVHYTDVSPVVVVMAVTKGGNNPFQYTMEGDSEGFARPVFEALREIAAVWGDTILSSLFIGWTQGYADMHRASLEAQKDELHKLYPHGIIMGHPRSLFEQMATLLQDRPEWLS